ncbi:MAG: hypothetical protein ACOVOQ_06035 [Flavobacterium sp.]
MENLRELLSDAIFDLSGDELTLDDYKTMISETEYHLVKRLISIAQWYKTASLKDDTFD